MVSTETLTPNGGERDRVHEFEQNVVVMRHGDRIDNVEPLWTKTAPRPWDPPLVDPGRVRAFCTGKKLRANLGFPIHRVFVSPFLRCVQTASEVVSALCAVDDDPTQTSIENKSIDPSKVKVSIEYGLCEVLNKEAMRSGLTPQNGNWGFNLPELEAMFPAGTVDHSVEPVYQGMPQWEESMTDARVRYENVFKALADKYPSENLLLVTHGEGVGVSVSAFLNDVSIYEVEYCASSHLKRQVSFGPTRTFTAGNFEVLTKNGLTGIRYLPSSTSASDAQCSISADD